MSWQPIVTAPAEERIILAFPKVLRPRKVGEAKQKGNKAARRRKKYGCDMILREPSVTIGLYLNGQWVPGRSSTAPFYDRPTHWMYLPESPPEHLPLTDAEVFAEAA